MPLALPSWFAADHVFRGAEGWYIGSPQSFKVGPYPDQADAEERSREITNRLKHCADIGTMVRTVRAFLNAQNPAEPVAAGSGAAAVTEPAPPAASKRVLGSIEVPPLREGEDPSVRFRTSRYFAVGEVWFFATRENIDVGPYDSKTASENGAQRLLKILKGTTSEPERLLAIYQFKSRPRLSVHR